MEKEKTPPEAIILGIVWVVLLFIFICMGMPSFLALLLSGVIVIAILIFIAIQHEKQPEVIAERYHQQKLHFYNLCKENRISNINNPVNRQKAELIARNAGILYENFEVFFNESFEAGKRTDAEAERVRIASIRKQEETEYRNLTTYARYTGREKRIKMIQDELSGLEGVIQLPGMIMSSAYQESERDWAIAGGLGGVGAAVDAQLENIEIRKRNAANREAVKNLAYGDAMKDAFYEAHKKTTVLREALKKAETALISNESSQTLLSLLDFSDIKCSVTQTGAVRIHGNVKLKEKHIIFEKLKAVVDGTVVVNVYQDGVYLGSSKIVLPMFGVSEKASAFNTICLCKAKKRSTITTEYKIKSMDGTTTGNIWAIEK